MLCQTFEAITSETLPKVSARRSSFYLSECSSNTVYLKLLGSFTHPTTWLGPKANSINPNIILSLFLNPNVGTQPQYYVPLAVLLLGTTPMWKLLRDKSDASTRRFGNRRFLIAVALLVTLLMIGAGILTRTHSTTSCRYRACTYRIVQTFMDTTSDST